MFACLAGGGQTFLNLKLSKACAQLESDEDSEEYLTFNTDIGLFQYSKLPYIFRSASAIFQSVIK